MVSTMNHRFSQSLVMNSTRLLESALSVVQSGNTAKRMLGLCCLLCVGAASADSIWTAGGSMKTARYAHTATLLLNGKVLVVGGISNQALASTELYDSVTNSWTSVAAINTPRWGHTASLLLDGRVLLVGGHAEGGGSLASAEIYDPVTNSWTGVGAMRAPRWGHTATLLADGKVLVVGGYDSNPQPGYSPTPASVEMYDPTSNAWVDAAPIAMGRYYHTATMLPNAKVLVSGGGLGSTRFIPADSELYDFTAKNWAIAGVLNQARGLHTATSLLDGRVLVAGGVGSSGSLTSAETYDSAANLWTNAGSLATARNNHTATRLPSGAVLVAGGTGNNSPSVLKSAERFDSTSNTWEVAASLATPRSQHTATLLPNGKVLVAGGSNDASTTGLATTELYETSQAGSTTRVAQFASRATVTPAQTVYGAFVLADQAKLLIAVRGPSLGILGVSSSPHPHPYLNLYSGSGQLVASSNQCSGATADNAAVVSFYQNVRNQSLSANDACLGYVSSYLPAGIYTFQIVPDPSVQSSSGEVLFEVTPTQ